MSVPTEFAIFRTSSLETAARVFHRYVPRPNGGQRCTVRAHPLIAVVVSGTPRKPEFEYVLDNRRGGADKAAVTDVWELKRFRESLRRLERAAADAYRRSCQLSLFPGFEL